MKYLIIYSHPNPTSFNAAIRQTIEKKFLKAQIEYATRDLYALNFNSILNGMDFESFKSGKIPTDIAREQDYIKKAEILLFIYPIWWFGMPSILKGYIERIFSLGFAYAMTEQGPQGILTDKKVVILNTTGGPRNSYEQYGFNTALKTTMADGIFGFCGMSVLSHKYFYGVPTISHEERSKMLLELENNPLF